MFTRSLLLIATLAGAVQADQRPLRFEAEDITVTENAWAENQYSEAKWNLWSTDKDADQKWSAGIVLQSPRVLADRDGPHEGAPPLHSVVQGIPPGAYYLEIGGVGRPLAISLDGAGWRKIDGSHRTLGPLTNERLDRGLVAMPQSDGRVYVGWRMLKTDPQDVAFNVYRRVPGHPDAKLNDTPVVQTTDFVDDRPLPGIDNEYFVATAGGDQGSVSKTARARPAEQAQNYLSIPLLADHTFQKCGIADLDGDGTF